MQLWAFCPTTSPEGGFSWGISASLSLGFLLSGLAVQLASASTDLPGFLAPLLLISLPATDTALAMLRRFLRATDIFSGDRDHLYDLLARRGLVEGRSVLVVWGITLALCGVTTAVSQLPPLAGGVLSALTVVGLAMWAIWLGALGTAALPSSFTLSRLSYAMRRAYHRYTADLVADIVLIVLSFYVALFLRFSGEAPGDWIELPIYLGSLTSVLPLVVIMYLFANAVLGLYNRIWEYSSAQEAISILGARLLGTLGVLITNLLRGEDRPIPLSVVLIGGAGLTVAFAILRYRSRLLPGLVLRLGLEGKVPDSDSPRTLVVGAGEVGQLLAWRMLHHDHQYHPIGFADDDETKQGLTGHDLAVLGSCERIPQLVWSPWPESMGRSASCSCPPTRRSTPAV